VSACAPWGASASLAASRARGHRRARMRQPIGTAVAAGASGEVAAGRLNRTARGGWGNRNHGGPPTAEEKDHGSTPDILIYQLASRVPGRGARAPPRVACCNTL